MAGHCPLCQRERELTFHHLVPRSMHRKTWCKRRYTRDEMTAGVDLCRDCHSALHQFITEKEMGRTYNTLAKLRKHPDVARFVQWVRGRRTGKVRTRRPK